MAKKTSNYILTNNDSLLTSIIPCLPGMRSGRHVKKEVLLLRNVTLISIFNKAN
jgi:hypothetical protein